MSDFLEYLNATGQEGSGSLMSWQEVNNVIMQENRHNSTTVGRDEGTATDDIPTAGQNTTLDGGGTTNHSADGPQWKLTGFSSHLLPWQEDTSVNTDMLNTSTFTAATVLPTLSITEVESKASVRKYPVKVINPGMSSQSDSVDRNHLETWAKFNIQNTESAQVGRKSYPEIYTDRTLLLGRVLRSVKMENTERDHKGRNKSKKKNKKGRMV